jgi:hypothetical protein
VGKETIQAKKTMACTSNMKDQNDWLITGAIFGCALLQ